MIANKVIYYFICDAILYATAVVTPLLTSKSGQQEIQTISCKHLFGKTILYYH